MKFYKSGRLERLRSETEVRQAEYRALTAEQKIARLDARLGVGVGAVKERTRIISAANTATIAAAVQLTVKKQKIQ